MTSVRLDALLDDVASKSSRNRVNKLVHAIEQLPPEVAERVKEQLAERDIRGNWVRPHQAVADAFNAAGFSEVSKSTIEVYRSRLNRD